MTSDRATVAGISVLSSSPDKSSPVSDEDQVGVPICMNGA